MNTIKIRRIFERVRLVKFWTLQWLTLNRVGYWKVIGKIEKAVEEAVEKVIGKTMDGLV